MTEPVVTEPTESTPEPVRHAAAIWGSLVAVLLTLLGVAGAVGVLSAEQITAVDGVLDYVSANLVPVGTALVGFFTLVSGIASSWATAEVARRKVTPVAKAARR